MGACRPRDEAYRLPVGTPIVLISIDTLRSDRLPVYGYDKVDTPAIDALAADSIVFQNAYSHIPLTLPAHASALTGLLPPEHGVRDNMGYRLDVEPGHYLPKILKQHGYKTGAAVSSFVLRGSSGLADGFDFFDDRILFVEFTDMGSVQRPGGETLERALEWVRGVRHEPFFLFFHIYEPHSPYEPAEPYASRYRSAYDGEVAESDAIIGNLLQELRKLDIYDRALIVLISDHGEHLGEHGYFEHGVFLYREALQVPMIMKLPKAHLAGTRVEQPAQLIDLLPTVLSLLEIEPPDGLAGRSLLELGDEGEPREIYAETAFPRLHFGWSDLASLVDYPYHYIEGPDPELYDLSVDPAETQNILRDKRRIYGEMKQKLARYDRTLAAPGEEDPETRQRLEALGYLGGGTTVLEGDLPDPKSRLHVLEEMRLALDFFTAKDFDQAAFSFRKVVDEEPAMIDAWEKLAQSLLENGQNDAAAEAYEEAMRLSEGSPSVALPAAEAYLRMGRLEVAKAHAEIALATQELARDLLAQIAIRQDDLEEAERRVEEAVAVRGTRLSPLITKADLRLKQERYEAAIAVSQQVETEFGDRTDYDKLRSLYFIRGQAYGFLGESEAAAEALLREIELSPEALSPYTHLAYLYALDGKAREAGLTLQRMVRTNNHAQAYAEAVKTLREMGDDRSAAAVLQQARQRWPDSPVLAELAG